MTVESLLTEADLAGVLQMSEPHVAALRRKEGWECTKLGRFVRYTPAQADRIVQAHRAGGVANVADASKSGPKLVGQSARSARRSA